MKAIISGLLLFFCILFSYTEDIIKTTDKLEYEGKYRDALNILREHFNSMSPDIKICWRIARAAFLVSEETNEKSRKMELFEEGINATKPFFNITDADKRDRAELIHWYAVNYASRIKSLGIFGGKESLNIVPEIFKLMDKCLAIDPAYAGAYLFKAKLQAEVPFFLGGDKFEMANNYALALKYAEKEKMVILADAAKALAKRNWDVTKKAHKADRLKSENYAFNKLDDMVYSYNLLIEAKKIYENKQNPAEQEKILYKEILKLLEEYK